LIGMPDPDMLDDAANANVIMIKCAVVNTVALTDWGDVYVLGDNSYG
jgi:hypothetical protein